MKKKNKTIEGKVNHVDLEGGYFTITTSSGEIYKLDGGGTDLRKAGVQAEVQGSLDEAGFGIGFGTPVLHVTSYSVKGTAR